eukprot:PITA_24457
METPSKQLEISCMTLEEEEEMQHDISKLQDRVQQISLSQKVTEAKMHGVEANMNGVQVNMDGVEANMDGMEAKMNGMDTKMEELKINLNKLLQQMVTNGERVVKETCDENKRNVNHDVIDSNVGLKTHHVPKINMRKFDGKDLKTWILQMEQFFNLHNVVHIATLCFEPNQFVWIDVFIGTLKDNIQHEVHLWEPDSLEKAFRLVRKMESKIMATKKPNTHNYKDGSVVSPSLPRPIRLKPQQLEEKREKGICYNCDSKYTKGHKCVEKKLFYIGYEEEEEKEQEMSKEEDILQEKTLDKEEMNLTISCNALARITTQTIKIEGYIKKKMVIVLIDSESTHNFIHCKIAKELNCFLYPAPECQVIVASGGTINCFGKCHNIMLSMGEYVLNSPMLSIPMGGVDVVLGVQWLQYLGTIAFNFQEIFIKFCAEGKELELRGIAGKPGKIINSNGMTKLLNNEQRGIISQLFSLKVPTLKSSISLDLQKVLDNRSKVSETPKGLPPIRDHDHAIHFIPGSVPPNIRLYRYPYAQKIEIECMVVEMLEVGIIQPSQSSLFAPVVLVHKKDGSCRMFSNYQELNKLTIKDKFPIPAIDELSDELHGSIYFTKLDLHSGYHQIIMKTEDILKTSFRTHEGHYEFLVMPFGLTNEPFIFQGLMNSIFKPFLRKFVLVFFDDILIYNKSCKDHVQHVDRVLKLWEKKQLYAKSSKCFFGVQEVEYLDHIVSHEGIKVHPRKINAIKEWKIPTSIKHLQGFLKLIGYYCKFV